MTYTVRNARKDEVWDLADLVKAVVAEAPTYSTLTFDRDKTANFIMDGIKGRPGTFLRVIADEEDKAVGGIMGFCEQALISQDVVARDIAMMMHPDHRGKCLREFFKIIDDFKQWALDQGAKLVIIGTSSGLNMDSCSRLLEKMGFQQIGYLNGHIAGE